MSTNPNQRNASPARKFEIKPAEFNGTSLLIGMVGPSGSGKTKSSLELAKGMQAVIGGRIGILDSENERALHYAKEYQFLHEGKPGLLHVPFHPPFPPSAYQAAYEFMMKHDIRIIITDSMTHEHDGVGGVLEMHEEDLRSMKDPSAWGRAKGERRELTEFMLQARSVHWILCYRAREKMRWITGRPPEPRGLMPVGNESLIYEMTISFLLPAGANGVPVMRSPYPDEELILKVPQAYRSLFTEPRQLSAALGMHLAAWACPSWKGVLPPLPAPMKQGQSTSVTYTSQSKTIPTAADAAVEAAATAAATAAAKTLSESAAPVDTLIMMYESASTVDEVDVLAPRTTELLAISSPNDCARIRSAANSALDRLDPPIVTDPPPSKPVATTGVVTQPQTAQATNGLGQAVTPPRQPAVMSTVANIPATSQTRVLSEIEQLNADGLALLREKLADFGSEKITQEQAAQLVIDHLDEKARSPKVGTEDGAQAQDEIMNRTDPPFKTRASLGVMVRHLKQCGEFPTYKQFCNADLPLCTTAENVFELWQMSGEVIDALPKQPQTDARLRAVKKVEDVDPTIKDGGPWLTKRIREAKAVTAAAAKALGITPAVTTATIVTPPVVTVTHAAGSNGAAANAPTELPSSTPVVPPPLDRIMHAPITSDVGQVLAVDLEKAGTLEATEEMRTRVDRAFLQKRIPTADAKTLQALCEAKKATFGAAA